MHGIKRAAFYARLGQLSRERLKRAGVTPLGYKLWTASEDAVVHRLYPDYPAIISTLKTRTYYAVRVRARAIGIVKRRKPWTTREMGLLKKFYPTCDLNGLCQILPGRTRTQISSVAALKKLKKIKKTQRRTGRPVFDEICNRAAYLNLSLRDVDEMAGTSPYFAAGRWSESYNHLKGS